MSENIMNLEVQRYLENMQNQMEMEKSKRMEAEKSLVQLSSFQPNKDANLVEYQLDLKEEIDRIYHLLSGHIVKIDVNGNEIWGEPEDDRLKIFSDYGVKQIMNIISFYINRNTLLSNYSQDTIMWKVKDFGIELCDLIYNRYEHFFYYPTPEELYEKYYPIIKKNPERYPSFCRKDNGRLVIDEATLYNRCLKESSHELESKLSHFPMIILSLVDSVHSTFQRALGGRERESLRKFMHVSQTANGQNNDFDQQKKQTKLLKPSTW